MKHTEGIESGVRSIQRASAREGSRRKITFRRMALLSEKLQELQNKSFSSFVVLVLDFRWKGRRKPWARRNQNKE
jgi:hypothetical protein